MGCRITLTGQVDWQYQRQAAEQDVRGLYGVVGASNQISIKPKVNTSNISDDIIMLCIVHGFSTRRPST
jgi:osmotically-inducible protein OsmY